MNYNNIKIIVSWALASAVVLFTASSCLGEATGPETFPAPEGFCFMLQPDTVFDDGQGGKVDEILLSDGDSVNVSVGVYDRGKIECSTLTRSSFWTDLSNSGSGSCYNSSLIYSSESNSWGSLGLFGASASHGSSFTETELCTDYYCLKNANSYYFYGPDINLSYPLARDVKFWAYYPKMKLDTQQDLLYDGFGFSNNSPYFDFSNDGNAGNDYDILYGSSSVIYGSQLGVVPLTLNHAFSAVWVTFSNSSQCDFGTIENVRIEGLYTSGRFYLDGTWTNLSVTGDAIVGYEDLNVSVSNSSTVNLISDDGFCAFVIPQTCPSDAKLVIEFNDGYSLREMTASMADLSFQMGKVYSLNINLDFSSIGYVHLDYPENYVHVPWQGGSYGYSLSDMDDFAVWCTCGNVTFFDVDEFSNDGIIFQELLVGDGGYVEDNYDDDYVDWYRNGGNDACSRLQMVVAPNFTSTPHEAVIRIYCGSDFSHKPYDLRIVQDACPNPVTHTVTAKDIVLPFNYNDNPRQSCDVSDVFTTSIPYYYFDTYSTSKNIKFTVDNTGSSDGLRYGASVQFRYDDGANPLSLESFYVYSISPNFSLSDVVIPYTVTVCGISSSANIILKAGNYSYRSLYLTPTPMTLIQGTSLLNYGRKQAYCHFSYRIAGSSTTYDKILYNYSTNSSNVLIASYYTLNIANTGIATKYSSSYISSVSVGNTAAYATYYELTTSGTGNMTINVVAPALTVSPSVLYFDCSGESVTFTVTSNTRWFMASKDSWIPAISGLAVNSTKVEGTYSYTLTLPANTGSPREGTITFNTNTSYGTPQAVATLTVRQYGTGNVGLEPWNDGGTTPITW